MQKRQYKKRDCCLKAPEKTRSKSTTSTLLEDHKQKLSAATDVVEQTDMLLTNVARSSPGVISAKRSDTCRGFAVQSPKLTRKGKKGKEKKPPMKVRRVNSKPGADWLENSSDEESEEPVLSLNNSDSSITVRINGQRIQMIVDTGSKYDIISSELHKTQFKNYELNQTQKRFCVWTKRSIKL